MVTREQYEFAKKESLLLFKKAGIMMTKEETDSLEVADFGLGELKTTGLQLITYINSERCCAKEMALLSGQTCPEHRHPPFGDYIGKEETFRVRYGTVYLYVSGEPMSELAVKPPKGIYTVFHEILLKPGQQYTIFPNTLHWFQAGEEGAVVSEFSTPSFDEYDIFSDPQIKRIPEVESL